MRLQHITFTGIDAKTDDWFDTAKVRRVLATCKEVISDLGLEN